MCTLSKVKIRKIHPWHVSPKQAIEIQNNLRARVHLKKCPGAIRYIAGMDVSSSRRSSKVWAGVVVLKYEDLSKAEEKWVSQETDFPYVPGLLSFREIPAMLEALEDLKTNPDVILCDGQGIAHPRGLGLASHLGILLGRATIGCAKSRLVGEYSHLGKTKGSYSELLYEGRVVGAVARTRTGVRPIFVSPGHLITLEEALEVTFRSCTKYRLPEPTRLAHILVNRIRRREEP